MPKFRLQATIQENVKELRRALGSITDELSRAKLAEIIKDRHPLNRPVNGTTVERWEGSGEPDIWSTKIMAQLAGVSYEEFALGTTQLDDAIESARQLTDEQVQRAERQEAEIRARQRSRATKRQRRNGG